MPILPYPFGEPRHGSAQFLATGAPFDDGVPARAAFLPAKFKSQEIKPPVVPASAPAKTQRLRLVQRQFQSELPQPFLNSLLERARLVPVIKAAHEVVRKAEQPALPTIAFAHFALKPQVQHIVQIHVGQHRGDYPALRRASLRVLDASFCFEDAGPQPFADQAYHRSIVDSLFQHPYQPIMPEMVEEPFDVSFDDKLKVPAIQHIGQFAHRIQRAASGPIAVTAGQKVRLEYRREDLRNSALHQLVL